LGSLASSHVPPKILIHLEPTQVLIFLLIEMPGRVPVRQGACHRSGRRFPGKMHFGGLERSDAEVVNPRRDPSGAEPGAPGAEGSQRVPSTSAVWSEATVRSGNPRRGRLARRAGCTRRRRIAAGAKHFGGVERSDREVGERAARPEWRRAACTRRRRIAARAKHFGGLERSDREVGEPAARPEWRRAACNRRRRSCAGK
jgi:hypothetical protein